MRLQAICAAAALALSATSAQAVEIKWIDWTSSSTTGGFTAEGTITTATDSLGVTYNNPNGALDLWQGPTDYWQRNAKDGRFPATSPYTSVGGNGVDNIPTGLDIVRLNQAGLQTLTFSKPVGNLVFAYVSLNGNGYGFDQDFELLSFGSGDVDGNGIDDCGYWGCGTSSKNFDVPTGEFQLLGTGEPHGALRFTGVFSSVTWRSLSAESWNGFTVGVQGTEAEVFPDPPSDVPLPAAGWLLVSAAAALAGLGRRRRRA